MTRQNQDYRSRIYKHYISRYLSKSMTGRYKYDRGFYEYWSRVAMQRFRQLLPEQKDAAICEVACGPGGLLYALKSYGYTNVVGIDLSAEQIRLARKVWPNVILGDAIEFLRNRPNTFDLIFALDFLEHFRKEEIFYILDIFYRSLKEGGRVILAIPNAATLLPTYAWGDFTHETIFSPNSINQVLLVVGFDKVQIFPVEPVPYGVVDTVRFVLWKIVKTFIYIYNLIETRRFGSGIFTRSIIATAIKMHNEKS